MTNVLNQIANRILSSDRYPFRVQLAVADNAGRSDPHHMRDIHRKERALQSALQKEARDFKKRPTDKEASDVMKVFQRIGVASYARNFPNARAFKAAKTKRKPGAIVNGKRVPGAIMNPNILGAHQHSKMIHKAMKHKRAAQIIQGQIANFKSLRGKKTIVGAIQNEADGRMQMQLGPYTMKSLKARLDKHATALKAYDAMNVPDFPVFKKERVQKAASVKSRNGSVKGRKGSASSSRGGLGFMN